MNHWTLLLGVIVMTFLGSLCEERAYLMISVLLVWIWLSVAVHDVWDKYKKED